MRINELINKTDLSSGDIIEAISIVGENRDIIIVKNDGIRDDNRYSVIIISSKKPEQSFRCDHNSLEVAMKKVLQEYITENH